MRRDRTRRALRRSALCCALTIACAGSCSKAIETDPAVATRPCLLLTPESGSAPEVRVALLQEVNPANVRRPRNDSERLLFAHLYQTLVRFDCNGSVQSGLAESWSPLQGGRSWRFQLRRGARFTDGIVVVAEDVRRSLAEGRRTLGGAATFDSVSVEDGATLVVHFGRPHGDVPALVADPAFAVMRSRIGSAWPLGTGPYRIVDPLPSGGVGTVLQTERVGEDRGRRVLYQFAAGVDPRELLDSGIDLLITGDPAAIEYAESRIEYISLPLPWDRTYVLLAPSRVSELRVDEEAAGKLAQLPLEMKGALARDAVRGDARPHETPLWWESRGACGPEIERLRRSPPAVPTAPYRISGDRRAVVPSGDRVARDLAERLVALAARPVGSGTAAFDLNRVVPSFSAGGLSVAVLGPEEFERSLSSGDDFLFVLPLSNPVLDPCHRLSRLAERVPWLALGWLEPATTIVALLEVRSSLVARQGSGPVALDWASGLRIYTTWGERP